MHSESTSGSCGTQIQIQRDPNIASLRAEVVLANASLQDGDLLAWQCLTCAVRNSVHLEMLIHGAPSLLSDQHWRELSAFLADESLRAVVVASSQPFVDDSPDDAAIKSLHPSRALLRDRWAFNREDLERVLATAVGFKEKKKVAVGEVELPLCDVLLVGGGSSAGCTSSIADLNSGLFVQQLLPPPITDTPDTPDF